MQLPLLFCLTQLILWTEKYFQRPIDTTRIHLWTAIKTVFCGPCSAYRAKLLFQRAWRRVTLGSMPACCPLTSPAFELTINSSHTTCSLRLRDMDTQHAVSGYETWRHTTLHPHPPYSSTHTHTHTFTFQLVPSHTLQTEHSVVREATDKAGQQRNLPEDMRKGWELSLIHDRPLVVIRSPSEPLFPVVGKDWRGGTVEVCLGGTVPPLFGR